MATPTPDVNGRPSIIDSVGTYMQRILERTVYAKPLKKELIIVLQDLCKIYSPSGHEGETVEYCVDALKSCGFKVHTDDVKNIFAVRGNNPGVKLVCINAHTDTVHRESDKKIAETLQYRWIDDIMTGGGNMMAGDDKCGIALALTLALYTDLPMKIILTTGEEVGGTGSAKLIGSDFKDVAFCFTVDRKGGNDIISEYCGRTCAPKEFVDQFIALASRTVGIKFVDTDGSYADTYVISQHTPCINISAGYYNAHTNSDFVNVNELYNVMNAVKSAIENIHELIASIDRAPSGWFKDVYADNPMYKRGKYIGAGMPDYITRYDGFNWSGDEFDYHGARGGRGSRAIIPDSRQQRLSDRVTAHGGVYNTGKKCHIDYDKLTGRDDKENIKVGVDDHLIRNMSMPEGLLLASYNDGKITNEQWDFYLASGKIQPFVHRIGVEARTRVNNARLNADISRENRVNRVKTNSIPINAPIHDDWLSLSGDYEDYFDNPKRPFCGEEEKCRKPQPMPLSFGLQDAIESDSLYDIDTIGLQSGYLPGSSEHAIFVDYITGNTTHTELKYYLDINLIDDLFYATAIRAKQEYDSELRLKQSLKVYANIGKDERDRTRSPVTIRTRHNNRQKRKLPKGANKTPLRFNVNLDGMDKIYITDFAIGKIDPDMWDDMLLDNQITKSLWRAGYNEQDFYRMYGKLSGKFSFVDDYGDGEKYTTNYKHHLDDPT